MSFFHLKWCFIGDFEKTGKLVGVVLYVIASFAGENVHLLFSDLFIFWMEIKITLILYKIVPSSELYQPVTTESIRNLLITKPVSMNQKLLLFLKDLCLF